MNASPRKSKTTVRAGHGVVKEKESPALKIVQKTLEESLNDLIESYNVKRGLGKDFYDEQDHTIVGYVTAIKLDDGYGVYKILDSEGNAEPVIKKIYNLKDVIVFFEALNCCV